MSLFSPSRLTLARKRRGLTKTALGRAVDMTARVMYEYESGRLTPPDGTLDRLADVLRFPRDFFFRGDVIEFSRTGANFRALRAMTAAESDAALAAGVLALEFSHWIDRQFVLQDVDIPDLRDHEPEAAAMALRQYWRLGERTISNMVHLLESKGVRVFSLAEEGRRVDAFSIWRGDIPFVFLNTVKSGERSRMDAAHELAHLCLHRHGVPHAREVERDAQQFAGAFLMPRGSVLGATRPNPSIDAMIRLKGRWRVSLSALAYRLRSVGLMTEWNYRSACIQISSRFGVDEPSPIQRETSKVLEEVLAALRSDGINKSQVAKQLGLYTEDLDSLVFGLTMVGLNGNGRSRGGSRESLRLIDWA